MSLIVCMKASGGIVLAADSRGTIGDPRGLTAINDTQVKIFPFGPCGLGLAGASEMGAALLDDMLQNKLQNAQDVDQVIQQIVSNAANRFEEWFRTIPAPQRPGVLMTVAGYRRGDNVQPLPMIYLLNSQTNFAPQLFGNTPCMSGVPQYAVYLVHRYYDPSIPLERAKALAEYLITETASQDPKVGGPIKMAQITPVEGYKELLETEMSEIHRANEKLNTQLREFFLEGVTR